jgi:hypothetical protein
VHNSIIFSKIQLCDYHKPMLEYIQNPKRSSWCLLPLLPDPFIKNKIFQQKSVGNAITHTILFCQISKFCLSLHRTFFCLFNKQNFIALHIISWNIKSKSSAATSQIHDLLYFYR